jgi:uncharacterized protein YgiM (DUF1202 family)
MKKNFFLIVGVMVSISTGVRADQSTTNATPAGTNAAAHRAAATHRTSTRPRRPAPEPRTVPLVPGPAVVAVGAGPVNVRGKAGLGGEVIGHVTNGEPVTVIEEVTKNSKADEPSAWAKIALPGNAHAWVKASFIDPVSKTVTAKTKLNLRAGPGENYSVLGTLEPGATVKEVDTKNGWIQIETPANTYAYVAAQYLKQEPATAMAGTTEPTTEPVTTNAVPETAMVTPATNELAMAGMTGMTNTDMSGMTNETMLEPTPVVEEPPPQRIIQHEGIVHYSASIQAPTRFQLVSPDTRKPINYLYTTSTNLDLNRYKGLHVIVTGEEGLDERWRNTPVITIHRIQVLD